MINPWSTSSLPKTSPRTKSLFTGVGPMATWSPISNPFTDPSTFTTAWQTSGWQRVVKSISVAETPGSSFPCLVILTLASPSAAEMLNSL